MASTKSDSTNVTRTNNRQFLLLVIGVPVLLLGRLPTTLSVFTMDPLLTEKCHSSYYNTPKCLNHTDGYGCECGPGFHWNTRMCMSTAIDSRLEFSAKEPVRYTLLLDKAFPKLKNFTIGFWIRLKKHENQSESTIMSYKHARKGDVFRLSINNTASNRLVFTMWGFSVKTHIRLPNETWTHIFWTWQSMNGKWGIFVNNTLTGNGSHGSIAKGIPSDGEFVLGQSSRQKFTFNHQHAFIGDIAHLNIWNQVLNATLMDQIFNSCIFMYCGNAVQWADLRSGTRGPVKMRWPSQIVSVVLGPNTNKPCRTAKEKFETCNKYCSDVIGAQCNMETVENIVWARTPAVQNASVPCPGQEENVAKNETYDSATRTCYRSEENDGNWGKPYIDECISYDLLEIKNEIREFLHVSSIEELKFMDVINNLMNHSAHNFYINPIDVATIVDLLDSTINLQTDSILLDVKTVTRDTEIFKKAQVQLPSLEKTITFTEKILSIVNNLLNPKHDLGWKNIKPPGVEGDNLLQVMEHMTNAIANSLQKQILKGLIDYSNAKMTIVKDFVEYKIETHHRDSFFGFSFPTDSDIQQKGLKSEECSIELLADDEFLYGNISTLPEIFMVSSFRYKALAKQLPNHDVKSKSKEDNVNTPIMALYLHHLDDNAHSNLSTPIRFSASYLDNFNISNAECVRVQHSSMNGSSSWKWSPDYCELIMDNGDEGVCACYFPGVFALTTDMYNVNWDRGIRRPILMNIASYFGCSMTILMCLASLIIHLKFKSSSSTASLHKNLAVSVVLSQSAFMVGIDRYDYPVVCQCFAVLLHYAFLSNYCWLMNEAFNQYIVITYSAHSHTDDQHSDSGSMFRYYILGWIFPGVLVGAFVGSQGGSYYAKDMCWIAWDNIWLFVAPALGFTLVSIMVLIYTAKEHNENSYINSENTNKVILIHMRGLWTQVILLTVSWSFAFLSLKMHDKIIKYLYAMMNTLQGAFFVVFFLFLNDEIQTVLKSKRKKKNLANQIYDAEHDDQSMESLMNYEEGKDSSDTVPLSKKTSSPKPQAKLPKLRIQTTNEYENNSGCEMVTSV